MPLPPKFNKFTTVSQVLASYSFQELITGQGQLVLYGIISENSVGVDYNLISFVAEGTIDKLDGSFSPATIESQTFKQNIIIKGTAYIECNFKSAINPSTLTFELFKYDGITPTSMGTAVISQTVAAGVTEDVFLSYPLNQTQLNQGDILRLVVTFSTVNSGLEMIMNPTVANTLKATIPVEVFD